MTHCRVPERLKRDPPTALGALSVHRRRLEGRSLRLDHMVLQRRQRRRAREPAGPQHRSTDSILEAAHEAIGGGKGFFSPRTQRRLEVRLDGGAQQRECQATASTLSCSGGWGELRMNIWMLLSWHRASSTFGPLLRRVARQERATAPSARRRAATGRAGVGRRYLGIFRRYLGIFRRYFGIFRRYFGIFRRYSGIFAVEGRPIACNRVRRYGAEFALALPSLYIPLRQSKLSLLK